MHAVEINTKYGLPETVRKPEHKLLLININRINFPALAEESNRWGFVGELAPSDIQTHYRSTRLPPDVTHVQNPVRYWLPTVSAQSPT